MIYTVTFNPSLDYIVDVSNFELGKTNRTEKEMMLPGGKGINVSIVLNNLGLESTALGFMAGFTGDEIVRLLKDYTINTDFIKISQGMSRINCKLRAAQETEINGMGPVIDRESLDKLYAQLEQLQDGDWLILAGSIPASMPDDIYESIMAKLSNRDIHIVVDATKDLLLNVLKYRPFLIKPNNHELEEIFNVSLGSNEEIITYAKKLQEMGARNVVISMAGDGAILVAENGESCFTPAPQGKVVNSVGAGDSMVAGFTAGMIKTNDIAQAFKNGVATGSASAFSEQLATAPEVEALLKQL